MKKTPFTAHPWHGINQPNNFPEIVNAYVEIVPSDSVKFEIDKFSGILKIDRPQKYSNFIPALYGFIPKTWCSTQVAKQSKKNNGNLEGDKDPLDICIISERIFHFGGIIAPSKPIGGIRLIDRNEVDDKIIAVLQGDAVYGHYNDVSELPVNLVERLNHYFLTYKNLPGTKSAIEIESLYGKDEALKVIKAGSKDYEQMSE